MFSVSVENTREYYRNVLLSITLNVMCSSTKGQILVFYCVLYFLNMQSLRGERVH